MQSVRTLTIIVLALGPIGWHGAAFAAAPATNQIEELTSPEVRARIAAGSTTILIPIGGTEQNGPYITLGKHNARVKYFATAIAQGLGNALVAPVIAYVPEGAISPPTAHMHFVGTISIPDVAFESMLDATARSFKQHGFRDVVFLGDHGGYQKNLQHVAERLAREWARDPACRVHAYSGYYQASQAPIVAALKSRGYSLAEIGTHAGLADTALTLATVPAAVRADGMAHAPQPGAADGMQGDPRRASAALGQSGAAQIIQTSVAGIAQLTRRAAPSPKIN
ncbi:creatininase family protein [Massilia sp. TWP1-3-3]|uniref:creatininase family protein n=1 Tax=Massilia sp. TWP1-3-3 TaxID=2804573 RepID=UPI003CE7A112